MRWRGRRQSGNVEDLRGRRVSRGGAIGIGGTGLVLLVLFAVLTGQDPMVILDQVTSQTGTGGPAVSQDEPYEESADDREQREFVAVVLGDTEDVWNQVFASELRERYVEPRLVLFSGAVESGCGFAQAYVIAHEVGHHVQNLLGISGKVQAAQRRAGKEEANELSVRLELQADCLAGVWASLTERQKRVLEQGDVEEAMNAAAAVGDDRIQMQGQGYVVPESFTHGSAKQRARWFRTGLESGSIESCDTFAAAAP